MPKAATDSPGQGNDQMFFFFSNRLGCLGSLLISAVVTIVLILIFAH
jgi:hypothetical protein